VNDATSFGHPQGFGEYARKLELLDKIVNKSKLSAEEDLEIGKAVERGIARRYNEAAQSRTA